MLLEIVDIDDADKKNVLITPMAAVTFPLQEDERMFIEALKAKVVALGAAGLAATQVGVAKPITAFHVTEDARIWREDVTHLVPLMVLINPSYEPLEEEGEIADWEGCYSGKNYYGKIKRYRAVRYRGQDENGTWIEGIARGFFARLVQHETDHCHHKMCIDRYEESAPYGPQEALLPQRKEELRVRKESLGLGADDPFPFHVIKETTS
ncbi:MAG: peptide deformylase [Alphaproteobacteria bacterium]|nr:peptide deformylase [Alphaproteobacteria bacterium]